MDSFQMSKNTDGGTPQPFGGDEELSDFEKAGMLQIFNYVIFYRVNPLNNYQYFINRYVFKKFILQPQFLSTCIQNCGNKNPKDKILDSCSNIIHSIPEKAWWRDVQEQAAFAYAEKIAKDKFESRSVKYQSMVFAYFAEKAEKAEK